MSSVLKQHKGLLFVVTLSNIEHNAKPAFVYDSILCGTKDHETLIDIECCQYSSDRGGSTAFLFYESDEAAERVATKYNKAHSPIHGHKICTSLSHEHQPNAGNLFLSGFLASEKEKKRFSSNIVCLKGLPYTHTCRAMRQLIHRLIEVRNPDEDLEYDDVEVLASYATEGKAVIKFFKDRHAREFQDHFHMKYLKNDVVFVNFLADDEYAAWRLEHNPAFGGPKDVALVAHGVQQQWRNMAEVRKTFHSWEVQDVNFVGDKGPAFVFLEETDAAAFFSLHKKGIKYRGKWIAVKLKDKKDEKRVEAAIASVQPLPTYYSSDSDFMDAVTQKTSAPSLASIPTPPWSHAVTIPEGPCDVRVNNLAATTTKQHLRDLFAGFELTKVVHKSKDDFACVGLETGAEAQRVVRLLSSRKVNGRTISMVITGAPPVKQ